MEGFDLNLSLERPLVFFDLETTGTDVAKDRIVEMAFVKVMPDGQWHVRPDKDQGQGRLLINPEMPIPESSSEVHGVRDEDVVNAPTFESMAPRLYRWLEGCDLAGFNSNRFDVPLLAEEFLRSNIAFKVDDRHLVDVQNIFHKMEQRTLRAALKFYCNEDLEGAHEALPDILATMKVFANQVKRYESHTILDSRGEQVGPLPQTVSGIAEFGQRGRNVDMVGRFVYNDQDEIEVNFGKYKGQKLREVLTKFSGYGEWMMKGDFPRYTKWVVQEMMENIKAGR
ncbi:3'-5' exonuclease [Flavobacteriales bacterium]|nr:3'-5' exonuclease [Flavobacteriales bacterium]